MTSGMEVPSGQSARSIMSSVSDHSKKSDA